MPQCYKNCKHNYCNYCTKYNEPILVSTNYWHRGLLIHPLDYLTIFYSDNADIEHLITICATCLADNTAVQNVCSYYYKNGFITYKQKKLLLHLIFDCYETNERDYKINQLACQVED